MVNKMIDMLILSCQKKKATLTCRVAVEVELSTVGRDDVLLKIVTHTAI